MISPEQTAAPLVVLGKNIGVEWSPERIRQMPDYLSQDSKITSMALGELMLTGTYRDRDIIISCGHTAGDDVPSESRAMYDYVQNQYMTRSAEPISARVHLEEKSLDTRGNALEVKAQYPEFIRDGITLMTVGFHLPRAKKLFNNCGIDVVDTIASEDVLASSPDKYAGLLHEWQGQARYRAEVRKEKMGRALLLIDPRGKLVSLITSRTRGLNYLQ